MQIWRHLIASTCLLLQRNLLVSSLGHAATTTTRASPFIAHNREMSDSYAAGSASVAFVTAPDENLAKKLATGLVEQQLAACVNIIPQIQSIYMWEGKVTEDKEYLLMIKTRSSRLAELTQWVRENHLYSVAEVITLPIETGNEPYLKWISDVVPPPTQSN